MAPEAGSIPAYSRTIGGMVSRIVVRCRVCGNRIILRITVAGGMQRFLFGCPHCRTEVHASLFADVDKRFELLSEDLEEIGYSENEGDLMVAINTDLPIHTSLIQQRVGDIAPTPFMYLFGSLRNLGSEDIVLRINVLQVTREKLFPHVRRAASYFARGNTDGISSALTHAPGGDQIDFSVADPIETLGLALTKLYAPLEDTQLRIDAGREWVKLIADANQVDESSLAALYVEYDNGPMTEHRLRVIDTALGALDSIEAVFPALWAELVDENFNLDEFRVMRDDFDTLKGIYQDIFELASRTLVFTARVANIARRGDVRQHSDGVRRNLNSALNSTTSANREPWLVDFPVAKRLYDAMKRHTRNNIGHRIVRYDFERGVLVYDDGLTENYLLFLIDYLHAVRLSHYLLDVCEIFWHTREKLTDAISRLEK